MSAPEKKLSLSSWVGLALVVVLTLGSGRMVSSLVLVLGLAVIILALLRGSNHYLLRPGVLLVTAALLVSLVPVDVQIRHGQDWHLSFPRVLTGGAAAKVARSRITDGLVEGEDYIISADRAFLVPAIRCILVTHPY